MGSEMCIRDRLEPFERTIVRVKLLVENPDDYIYRNMLVTFVSHQHMSKCNYFLDESLAAVRDGGIMYLNLRNQTSSLIAVKAGTVVGSATPVNFVFKAINRAKTETDQTVNVETVSRVYECGFSSTSTELSSLFHTEFPSSTEASEGPLSEAEVRKRTGPELLKPIPGPDLETVEKN